MATTQQPDRVPRIGTSPDNPEPLGDLLTQLAYLSFVVTNILSVCAVKLGVGGVPFRMWTLLAAGALLAVAEPSLIRRAIEQTARLLVLITAVACLGFVVSVIAQAPTIDILRQIVEIHAQALVGTIVGYALMLRFGIARVLGAFLIAYAITAAFAIGQVAGIPGAWAVREHIATIANDSIFLIADFDPRERAMGLSFTPVLFATQSCIALAAVMYIRIAQGRLRDRRIDWVILAASIVLLGLCTITGNRSPTLGIALFFVVYLVARKPVMVGIILPAVLVGAGVLAFNADQLERTGLRVARTNSSSENRSTLRTYGLFLLEQRPIGHGLTFDSTREWAGFYSQSIYLPNPDSIRKWALHNYYFGILNKYGILILFVIPWILPRRREHIILWLAFLPYIVHIFYHNDGPFQSDFLVFYTFAAALLLLRRPELFRALPPALVRMPWRRAFAPLSPPADRDHRPIGNANI